VVIDDLDIEGITRAPDETDTPTLVNTDAVLACPAALERLKPISRGHPKIIQRLGGIQNDELPKGSTLNIGRKPLGTVPVEEALGIDISEAPNHAGP